MPSLLASFSDPVSSFCGHKAALTERLVNDHLVPTVPEAGNPRRRATVPWLMGSTFWPCPCMDEGPRGHFLRTPPRTRIPSRDSPFLTSWPTKASPPGAITSEMKLQQISVEGHRHGAGSPGVPRQPLRQLPSLGQDPVAVYTYKRLSLIILVPPGPHSSLGRSDFQESRATFLTALLIPGTHEPSMPTLKTRRPLQGPHRFRAATSYGLCQPPPHLLAPFIANSAFKTQPTCNRTSFPGVRVCPPHDYVLSTHSPCDRFHLNLITFLYLF